MTIRPDPGSFRDPSGGVFEFDGDVYRFLKGPTGATLLDLGRTEFFQELVSDGSVTGFTPVDRSQHAAVYEGLEEGDLVVQHPRLPLISYFFEWPFEMLKAAAECQMKVTRDAFANGYQVKDATAFNLQFVGTKPTFIDVASIEPYQAGSAWTAYAQFCQMFLNPLLFQALTGVAYQPWLRGLPEGLPVKDLRRVLPFRSKLRPGVFQNVVLQDWLNARLAGNQKAVKSIVSRPIPASSVAGTMKGMAAQVSRLKRRRAMSTWSNYEATKSHYSAEADQFKEEFVRSWVGSAKPEMVVDLGCNTGQFSVIAAENADYVVGVDGDEASVGALYERVKESHTNVLPLVIDLLSPSPSLGWAGSERPSFFERCRPDMFLCLALVHHLAIGGNVPLAMVVRWLASVAPRGVVEFVPKDDAMVQRLLVTRPDVFPSYTQDEFEARLEEHFTVRERASLPGSSRVLYSLGPR